MSMIRFCPNCQTERSLHEIFCEGQINDRLCGWDLAREPIRESGWRPSVVITAEQIEQVNTLSCINGHLMADGDLICLTYGAEPADNKVVNHNIDNSIAIHTQSDIQVELKLSHESLSTNEISETYIDDWRLLQQISESLHVYRRYHVEHRQTQQIATLTLYAVDREPDNSIYQLLKTLPRAHVPDIIEAGRWQGQAYVVSERLSQGSLADLGIVMHDIATIKHVVSELGEALHCFAEAGLRLCDLRPETLLVRTRQPLDLVVTDFGSARVAEFDLEIISPLKSSYYMAPESIAGGVSISSDWWSLGIILLEQLTQGECFKHINPQAFMIHILTNGVVIPNTIDSDLNLLLRGLLAKNHHQRWQWQQVKAWLNGEPVSAPAAKAIEQDALDGIAIELNQHFYRKPELFALAAAEQANEAQAMELLQSGSLITWLNQINYNANRLNHVRYIMQHDELSSSFKLMLTLKVLNLDMPLVYHGEVVSSAWLIQHPIDGYQLISSIIPEFLRQLDSENWLWRLHERIATVYKRAHSIDIELDDEIAQIHLLSTSRAQLLALWQERWQLFPDAIDAGVLSLMERSLISDEDLIILLSCSLSLFKTVDVVIAEVINLANELNIITFSAKCLPDLIKKSRPELHKQLNDTISGFAKTGYDDVNQWVEQYRLEKRLPLVRLLLLLSIEKNQWLQPEKHQYIAQIIDYFSKKVTTSIMQGPLVRMKLGAVTARIDLAELGSENKPATEIIDHLLARTTKEYRIDPVIFIQNPQLNHRLASLQNQRLLDFRDSGVNCLYLGFPFLFYREEHINRLPRIAPVFLWPINIDSDVGAKQRITLTFDHQRDEVRINPALENMLGKTLFTQLVHKRDELLARSALTQQDVMEQLSSIGLLVNTHLVPLNNDIKINRGDMLFDCSAVLFNINFVGQVIGEDLRLLKQLSPTGTALETALRLNTGTDSAEIVTKPAEYQRFLTAASDPSQENAIFKARQAPGLLIEGPPGTGKSQTIVNMVADAIGRKKTLLIICQKKAALDVVYKRLVAEQLSSRCMMINAINTDRLATITSVREQVSNLLKTPNQPLEILAEQRQGQADYITTIEQRLDEAYQLIHHKDSQIGLNYRQLISELISLSKTTTPLSAPKLRPCLQDLNLQQLELLENECAPIIRYWLPANYEHNPLAYLLPFAHDEATTNDFTQAFEHFIQAEKARVEVLILHQGRFDFDDPTMHRRWLKIYAQDLLSITEPLRQQLNQWLKLFKTEQGTEIILQLESILAEQQTINYHTWQDFAAKLVILSDEEIINLIHNTQVITSPSSWLSVLNIKHRMSHHRVNNYLARLGYKKANSELIIQLLHALQLEQLYRPIRQSLSEVYQQLDLTIPSAELGHQIADDIAQRINQLKEVQRWAKKLSYATRYDDVEKAVLNSQQEVTQLLQDFDTALLRYEARSKSLNLLNNLDYYLKPEIYAQVKDTIDNNQATPPKVLAIENHLIEVTSYQYFRLRACQLSTEALALLERLRTYQAALQNIPEQDLDGYFRQLVNFEARLSWKVKLEHDNPALLADNQEHEQQIIELQLADNTMRQLNRQFLAESIDCQVLGSLHEWEAITRLTGQRALRLREFINRGIDLGLMMVRPVWLMTPDIASQILPLKAGLFDVVIYDEASQMPVEYALPTLYRAKTIIVSGDEKQMPPTSFFSTQIQIDEEELPDVKLSYEELSEKEQQAQESDWNKREIMDCPDLLQLARSILPSTTLQIHYRSNYRELINFSNTAFYHSRLNVPVRHSKAIIEQIKPIELIAVDGIYKEQTNRIEADCVLQQIIKLWQCDLADRPTIGVVTFNKKQAELISSVVNQHIADDEDFKQIYLEESNRQDNGEDMSFFIKNVENVQGDERDIIIFSTTFGRNELGTFRRNFGVLGQQGGERRLNVAITRAKSRIVIVSSMPIDDISDMLLTQRQPQTPRDYLQSYLEYARTLTQAQWDQNESLLNRMQLFKPYQFIPINYTRDGFLNDVAQFLDSLNISYDYLSGNDVFSLDFAIKDPQTNLYLLGIECDPPYNPLLANARAREIWRIKVLQRSIPHIYRISSTSWFSHKQQIQQTLQQLIAKISQKDKAHEWS